MTERGVINHQNRARQLILFEGCDIDGTTITPTDIDGCIEYHDRTWILIEVKTTNAPVTNGQDVLIRRFILDGIKAGKENLGIIAEHDNINPSDDVILRDCAVRSIYVYEDKNVSCRKPKTKAITVRDCINEWVKYIDKKKI